MTGTVDREELRGLFLFEALTDEQLDWLAQRGSRRVYDACQIDHDRAPKLGSERMLRSQRGRSNVLLIR